MTYLLPIDELSMLQILVTLLLKLFNASAFSSWGPLSASPDMLSAPSNGSDVNNTSKNVEHVQHVDAVPHPYTSAISCNELLFMDHFARHYLASYQVDEDPINW